MELIRNILNSGGESSYFTYVFFLLAFIIFVFGSIAFLDYMFGRLFNKQEE
jgi:hypothetical protein